jgi:hypothetical protein
VWYVLGTLRVFPDEITYFNELVGGPERGFRYLVDYTQDWGQTHKELRDYLRSHPGPMPSVAYYTRLDPSFYGVSFRRVFRSPGEQLVTPFRPQPGRYVIGVAPLYGLTGFYRPNGALSGEMEWFRRSSPAALVGHALHVYDVRDTPGWVAQCTVPAKALDAVAISEGLGSATARQIEFDCTAAWIYPSGGTDMGIYVLHHRLLDEPGGCLSVLSALQPTPTDPFVWRHLDGARLSYEKPWYDSLPALALYERGRLPVPAPPSLPVRLVAAGDPAGDVTSIDSSSRPVSMDGPLAFVGTVAFQRESLLEVETWWRVTDGPISRPFSIMAHLVSPQGDMVGVGDGLGVSPLVLTAGDVVVQRHRFPKAPREPDLWLRTGVYWLDTMERWRVDGAPERDALLVPLAEVTSE